MNIEQWPTERPIDYPRNARKIPEKAVDAVAMSIREYGFVQPIVVDSAGVIVIGHVRRRAARKLGLEQVPVLMATDLSPAKIKALRLAENRTHEETTWDKDLLAMEFGELQALEFDLGLTGFGLGEIRSILPVQGLTDEDEVPEVPKEPVSRLGDLWLLGEHRVLCGDSTSKEAIEKLMDAENEDAIVTDPPYGVGVKYDEYQDSAANLAKLIPKFMAVILAAPCAVLTPGVPSMWLYPQPAWLMMWIHPAPSGGCPWGFSGVNPILAYGPDPYLARGLGRRPDSLVAATDRKGVTGHPTPKPMAVWSWLIERVTPSSDDVVLDIFLGSGTTLIACEKLHRRARGVEISPRYVDVSIVRWQNFTGKSATLDGHTFAEIAQERSLALACK